MSEPFGAYMRAKERTATARAKCGQSQELLERRIMEERMAEILSQHEPAHSIGIDRQKLHAALHYVRTGRLPEAEYGE